MLNREVFDIFYVKFTVKAQIFIVLFQKVKENHFLQPIGGRAYWHTKLFCFLCTHVTFAVSGIEPLAYSL